jgi:tRNA U34 5-carboxymethylaminomethyl modifying GTPase MnmE/TrmE
MEMSCSNADIEKVECEVIDYAFLIYVYMICADEQEHIYETRALDLLMKEEGVNAKTKEEAGKIISQEEDRIPVQEVIDSIPEESYLQCIKNLAAFSYVDGYCDPLERDLLDEVAKKWGFTQKELNVFCAEGESAWAHIAEEAEHLNYSQQFNLGEKVVLGADRLINGRLLKFMKKLKLETIRQKLETLENKILLSGPEYNKAIEECRQVAQEDIEFTSPALETTRDILQQLRNTLKIEMENITSSTKANTARTAKEVTAFLQETGTYLENEIFKNLEKVNASLYKKKRAMQYFTISFIGKTKAGKSTLHAVVTGEGEEAIGVGKQRTTRVNRVYEWKNIRIIDTPGIGAPGGKTDEEIAESVIDESDVICFVLNNNNQQETEFAFLKKLKEKAKPLLILLNVKENLTHPKKLERFLQDPDKLFSIEDKKKLGGHFDRIKRYAEQHYGNAYFEIVPAQLYAALLSQKEEDEVKQRKLMQASRLQKFLDSLKVALIQHGIIRRSQTLLGCTAGELEPAVKWATDKSSEFEDYHAKIHSYHMKGAQKLKDFAVQANKEIKREFGKVFSDLKGTIQEFAEDNWDRKEKQLKEKWTEHIEERFKTKKRLEGALQKVMNSYANDVQDLLDEIGTEISLIAKLHTPECELGEQDSSTFMKNFMRIGGGLLGVASSGAFLYAALATGAANWWNPLGWGLMVGGIVFGLLSGFFTSKAEKMRKAVNNITETLRESVDEQEETIMSTVLEDCKAHMDNIEKEITTYFSVMEQGLESFMKGLKHCRSELAVTQDTLNRAYAKRVFDWVTESREPLDVDTINNSIVTVNREIGKKFEITVKNGITVKKTPKESQSVLQEDLIIKGE